MMLRVLLVAFSLLPALVTQARYNNGVRYNPLPVRLDAIFRLVSQGNHQADGQKSGLVGKRFGQHQYAPARNTPGVSNERYTWSPSTGRWSYTATLNVFPEGQQAACDSFEQRTIRTLNQWAGKRDAEPADLSEPTASGTIHVLWRYNDVRTRTAVRLIRQQNDSRSATTVLLRVDAI